MIPIPTLTATGLSLQVIAGGVLSDHPPASRMSMIYPGPSIGYNFLCKIPQTTRLHCKDSDVAVASRLLCRDACHHIRPAIPDVLRGFSSSLERGVLSLHHGVVGPDVDVSKRVQVELGRTYMFSQREVSNLASTSCNV
jgi:hypothetical protein